MLEVKSSNNKCKLSLSLADAKVPAEIPVLIANLHIDEKGLAGWC